MHISRYSMSVDNHKFNDLLQRLYIMVCSNDQTTNGAMSCMYIGLSLMYFK